MLEDLREDPQWPREGCHGVPRGGEEPARDPSAVMSPRFGASERLGPGPQVGLGGGVAGIQPPRGCANAVPSVAGTVTRGQLRPGEQMRTKNILTTASFEQNSIFYSDDSKNNDLLEK